MGSDVTANGGIIEVNDVTKGLWSFVETEAPAGYCADSTPISVYVREGVGGIEFPGLLQRLGHCRKLRTARYEDHQARCYER